MGSSANPDFNEKLKQLLAKKNLLNKKTKYDK